MVDRPHPCQCNGDDKDESHYDGEPGPHSAYWKAKTCSQAGQQRLVTRTQVRRHVGGAVQGVPPGGGRLSNLLSIAGWLAGRHRYYKLAKDRDELPGTSRD